VLFVTQTCFPIGGGNNLRSAQIKRKRVDGTVKTPAMIIGTGAATSGVITVKTRKWLYVSMLHPETTEDLIA
jgi:hypothetical protein